MPPDVDRLLANARWVKALAVRLVADDAAADDLAQETWLRALERPPRDATTERSLRAWLRRVVERFALQRRRHDEAAASRERAAAAREAQSDVADVVAHAELHRRVVDAVLALEEPYRATILLRFFEDEPPARIAERMHVPQKTVYTRLQRALERLRARFEVERRPGGELHAWIAPLAIPLATPATPIGSLRELLLMSGRMRSAAAALIVAGVSALVWRGWPGRGNGGTHDAPAPTATPVAAAADETTSVGPAQARRDAEQPATGSARSLSEINEIVFSGSIALTGRVVDESAAPIEGARIECSLPDATAMEDGLNNVVNEEIQAHGFWDAPCAPPRLRAASDASGRFGLRGLRTGMPYKLSFTTKGFRSESRLVPPGGWSWSTCLGAGEALRVCDVVLTRGRDVAVHVVDARGDEVGGAAVFSDAWPAARGFLWPGGRNLRGVTDEHGSLTLSSEKSAAMWIVVRARDGREASLIDVRAPPADAPDADVRPVEIRLDDGEELHVRVRDGDGDALAGLRVTARSKIGASGATIARNGFTDDAGEVIFRGLPLVEREVSVAAPGGMPTLDVASTRFLIVASGTRDVELRIALAHAAIPVRFVDSIDGAPVRATALLVVDAEVDGPDSGLIRGGRDVPTRGVAAIAADATRGTILLSPPQGHPVDADRFPRERQSERFRVIVDARDHARTWLGPFDPAKLSATEALELRIERGRLLQGVVVEEAGAAIPGARVHEIGPGPGRAVNMFTWQTPAAIRAARTEADGRFSIGPLSTGAHALVVDATGFVATTVNVTIGASEPAPVRVVLHRGVNVEGEVHLEPDEEPSAFVVVLDRRGARVPDLGTLTTALDDAGHFSFTSLPTGEYAILALRPPADEADWFRTANRLLGKEETPAAAQVVRFALADAGRTLALDPWREGTTRRRLDTTVIDPARPGANEAVLLYLDGSGLPHRQTVALNGGRLVADLPEAKKILVLLAEAVPATDADASAGRSSWYVGNAVLSMEDLKRGVPPIHVRRGQLNLRVRTSEGSAIDDGATLWISFFVDPGFSGSFPELLMGNTRTVALPRDGALTLSDLPVGRTWLYARDGSSKGRGEVYVNVVENEMTSVELPWK